MCREQLGKLPPKVGELTAEGAAVLGISIDTPEAAGHEVEASAANLLSGIDVAYALGLFANCVLAAALFGGLVYVVFRKTALSSG